MLLEKTYEILKPNVAEKVMLYVLEHVDRNFIFSRSYNDIQRDTGASQPTIARVFKALEETGAAKHISKSQWLMTGIIAGHSDHADGNNFYVRNEGP